MTIQVKKSNNFQSTSLGMPRPTTNLFMLLIILLIHLIPSHVAFKQQSTQIVTNAKFTSEQYTGYISENVALPQRTFNTTERNPILIRFIDASKPSIQFETARKCSSITLAAIVSAANLRLVSDDNSFNLFEIDPSLTCVHSTAGKCACYIQIKLKDDSVRYKLNREAKSSYKFRLKLDQNYSIQETVILVQILDDNDLEPMFDPSEYEFELNEFDQSPAFTNIGQVFAKDPDLGKHSELRYYLNNQDLSKQITDLFGVDWFTGHIFLKKSLSNTFRQLFNGTRETEKVIEFEVKSLDNGVRHNVVRNLLRSNQLYSKPVRTRKMLDETFMSHETDLHDDETDLRAKNNQEINDRINYKLVNFAASLNGPIARRTHHIDSHVYYGTSIEAAYVTVKLVRSFKTRQNFNAKFTRLAEMSVSESLSEQIEFKVEKYGGFVLPFGIIEIVHVSSLKLRAQSDIGVEFTIERVYMSNEMVDVYLVFIQPSLFEIHEMKKMLEAAEEDSGWFTVNAYDEGGQVTMENLVGFEFSVAKDLKEIMASSCYLEPARKDFELNILNPSQDMLLFQLVADVKSVYGSDMCKLFLSTNHFYGNELFHVEFAKGHNQTSLSVDKMSGVVKLERIFYGKLIYLFQATLWFKDAPIAGTKKLFSVGLKSVDQSPRLNGSTPIYAVMNVNNQIPMVNFFKKNSNQNVFDTLKVTLTNNEMDYDLAAILSALNWNYNEYTRYESIYCFNGNDLRKIDVCPVMLNKTGRITLVKELTDNVNLFVRITNDVRGVDSTMLNIKYINIGFSNSSSSVEFEHTNCSVLVRLIEENTAAAAADYRRDLTRRKSNKIVEFFNFEQSQVEPVLLVKMNVKHNESDSRFKFTLREDASTSNQLDECFDIDAETGSVFFKCKWPFAHHSLFKANENVARIEKHLKIKVRKYPGNVEAHTFLNVQFEISANGSISDKHKPSFNILMFNCAQQYKEETSIKETYLANKLLANDFKHMLRGIKSSNILTVNSNAVNFHERSFDIIYTPSNTRNFTTIPAGTGIYRIDLVYLLHKLGIEDSNDEAMFYEFRVVNDAGMFRLNRLTGIVELAIDWHRGYGSQEVHVLIFKLVKTFQLPSRSENSLEGLEFKANIHFDVKEVNVNVLQRPALASSFVSIQMTKETTHDYLLMPKIASYLIDSRLSVSDVYNVSYQLDQNDLPFYVDSATGDLFYNSLRSGRVREAYDLKWIAVFKNDDRRVHGLSAIVHVVNKVNVDQGGKEVTRKNKQVSAGTIDLSMPITSVDFISNMQCQLIGFFTKTPAETFHSLVRDRPRTATIIKRLNRKNNHLASSRRRGPFKFSVKNSQRLVKRDIEEDSDLINKFMLSNDLNNKIHFNDSHYERNLLWESFYSMIHLDNSTGALYFDPSTETNQQLLYSKLAQLIQFYHYENSMTTKRLKVDAIISNGHYKRTTSLWVDLIFAKSHSEPTKSFELLKSDLTLKNSFEINSNNLLNLFNNGDEFITKVTVMENSPSNRTILNIRSYFVSKINLRSSRNIVKFNMIKDLRFYLTDAYGNLTSNNMFMLSDSYEGLLKLQPSVQFDYEVSDEFSAKVMVVQHAAGGLKFIYWLDVVVNVANEVDEKFLCEKPIYLLEINENETKNKKLLTLYLQDFDMNENKGVIADAEKNFKAEILSGNERGFFAMNGLDFFTGANRRRLDRETIGHHEIVVRVDDLNAKRSARCVIAVELNDLNDNRPIVNDIELVIYDKLDTRLVDEMQIPIANAIAIDPDSISKLIYRILGVRYFSNTNRHSRQNSRKPSNKLTKKQIAEYFSMNSTNGNLYAQRTPCVECTILVTYRATDIGKNRNRISRHSSIKLHVKKLPVSLFKTGTSGIPSELINDELDVNPAIKTFDLRIQNSTRFTKSFNKDKIVLEVEENTKLGEKLYQINIEQRIALNQLAIIYFNLLDDPNNSNFYVSNNDGSLYLIKSLDYESKQTYNLTILITNWLGQIEYVHIELKVKDTNDHRPQFSSSSSIQNEQITFGVEAFQVIDIVTASDKDTLDHNKLTFNIENCLYMPQNLLVIKNSSTSACELFNAVNRVLNSTHQTFGLNLKLHELREYLNTTSDFFMSQKRAVISFYMDISVKDSSTQWSDITRVNLNIYLNSSKFYQPHEMKSLQRTQMNTSIEYGFKKNIYLIKLQSTSALSVNTELIRLSNEFVTFNGHSFEKFRPFQLEFYADQNPFGFVDIEPNFGLVYFNQTINTEALSDHMLQVTVACTVKGLESSGSPQLLHSVAKVIIFLDSSLFYSNDLDKDLKYYPVWSHRNLQAYVTENSPTNTWLTQKSGKKFTVKSFLIEHTLHSLAKRIPNIFANIMVTATPTEYLHIEPFTGYIRTARELDYETNKAINLTLTLSLRNSIHFEQVATLTVNIINCNDNEPKLTALRRAVDLKFISEIMRTMTLFTVLGSDADNTATSQMRFTINHVRIAETNNCSVSYLTPGDWFQIYTSHNSATVQLTDLGYDALIHFSSKINHFHLRQCYFTVHLSVSASDGLFTNDLGFQLNVQFDEELSLIHVRNRPVPVLTSLELPENISNQKDEVLINILDTVHTYLNHHGSSHGFSKAQLARELTGYELKNYANLFTVNNDDKNLSLRGMNGFKFDRETRDAFELFIGVKHGVLPGVIPEKFRILVKLNDANDNSPQFFEPLEASLTSYSARDTYGFNQTFRWSQIVASSEHEPIMTVNALDLDSGPNGEVHYVFNSSEPRSYELVNSLITLDHRNGKVYLSPSVNHSLMNLIEATYLNSNVVLDFNIIAKDSGHPQMSTAMRVRLNVLFNSDSNSIRFNQTFYRFQIPESIDLGFVFGYVNSLAKFNGSVSTKEVVFSIVSGDEFDEFKIDHRTGALSVQSKLAFETIPSYLLTIGACPTTDSAKCVNATVRIDLDKIYDSSLRFSNYEYNLKVPENIGKMTQLIQLNVEGEKEVSYQLLNHLDKFYMNEKTGHIYNKVTFDYELLKSNRMQLQIKAKKKKKQLIQKHLEPMEASCLLNIQLVNVNDNPPQFEKTVYFSNVQVNGDSSTTISLLATLLNPLTNKTSTSDFKFVTKVSAKDIDSPLLTYSMLSQTEHGTDVNLFQIDPANGIVYLDYVKYNLLKQLDEVKSNEFTLQLSVSDSMLTSQARLTVQIEDNINQPSHVRPKFKIPSVNLHVDIARFKAKQEFIRLFNFKKNTIQTHPKKFYSFNFDSAHLSLFFSIKSNKLLVFNLKAFKDFAAANLNVATLEYHVAVLVCERQNSPGLCDQLLVKINLTSVNVNQKPLSTPTGDVAAFAYRYSAKTVQQSDPADTSDNKEPLYDDYYLDNADSMSNERFYTEIRLTNSQKTFTDLEFELLKCSFTSLNVTYSNQTLQKAINDFTSHSLTTHQIKTTFLLNKNNGVLSSRQTINQLLPGIYTFTIRLRSNHYYSSLILDSMKFKLIIIPPTTSLSAESKYLHNYFKFSREMYKLSYDGQKSFGQVSLVETVQPEVMAMNNKYQTQPMQKRFIKKFSIVNKSAVNFIKLNSSTGEITLLLNTTDHLRANFGPDVTIYVLGTVEISDNTLEYVCEVTLDISSLTKTSEATQTITDTQFLRHKHHLTLTENLPPNIAIFKFIALNENNSKLTYTTDSQTTFQINPSSGILSTAATLDKELTKSSDLTFKVTACELVTRQCSDTLVHIDLIDTNDNAPVFQDQLYHGAIREDSLPGTVVTTVIATDFDSENMPLEYYILNGDVANQFAISSDGKVYTRLMLDRELISHYSLDIMAFDGQYKALTKLDIKVLNVNDNRPICHENMVNLNISESTPIGTVSHVFTAIDPDDLKLNYEIVTNMDVNKMMLPRNRLVHESKPRRIPFAIHQTQGSLTLIEPIDFEDRKVFSFFIRVYKRSESRELVWDSYCMVKVAVNVLDANDNPPKFPHAKYLASIKENSEKGSLIDLQAPLAASDLDSYSNRVVRYSFITNNSIFTISPNTGIITLTEESLDRESTGDWVNLTVRATDLGGLYSETNLAINIIDLNDNIPEFEQPELFYTLQENLPAGFLVGKVTALDRDVSPITRYALVNTTETFKVDKITGQVVLSKPIDYETQESFVLEIAAYDPEYRLSGRNGSIVRLHVDVIDLNDNTPQFNETGITIHQDENAPANTTLWVLAAYDRDRTALNKNLEFTLEHPLFGIEKLSGRLFNKVQLDYEKLHNSSFNLSVTCSDTGAMVKRKNTTIVRVNIGNVNDNTPEFKRQNQTIIIRETFELGRVITNLLVTDNDDPNELLTFSLIEQQVLTLNAAKQLTDPLFSITPNGSLVLIRHPQSESKYIIHVRVYDRGTPPLFADSFLTVNVADKQSNEPTMSESEIRIVTLGSVGVHEPASLIKIESGQVIGKLTGHDADSSDILFYQLPNTKYFSVNELTGVVKSNIVLIERTEFNLKPLVTDKKFITESDLRVKVQNVNTQCLQNSVYMKLNVWSEEASKVASLSEFVRLEYMARFREIVSRILNSKSRSGIVRGGFGMESVEIVGLRESQPTESILMNIDKQGKVIELLFAVKNNANICLNSKLVSKLLNRRKAVIVKRMRLRNSLFNFKVLDISYNSECFGTENHGIPSEPHNKFTSICSINQAFENCHLNFIGYNEPRLCEHTKCFMIPKHSWSCDENKEALLEKNPLKIETKTYVLTDNKEDDSLLGGSCRKPNNPCQNNAICKQVKVASLKTTDNVKVRVHCFCPNGFRGRFCEEDINECAAENSQVPCVNGAHCVNTHGSYYCNCTLKPTSLCYNTLSPQYSASKTDNYKYYGRSDAENIVINRDGFIEYKTADTDEPLLFGMFTTGTIRQALLGTFGAICGVLIVLTLAAGFVCQMNMNKRRNYRHEELSQKNSSLIDQPTTSNSVADCLSGSDSNGIATVNYSTCDDADPCSSISSPSASSFLNHKELKATLANGRMSKNRSSMTASLISSTNGYCSSDVDSRPKQQQRRNGNKYNFNNLLFARLKFKHKQAQRNQIPLAVCSRVSSQTSSGSNSPHAIPTYTTINSDERDNLVQKLHTKHDLIKETDTDTDTDDKLTTKIIHSNSSTLKPIKLLAELKNDMSSFNRERPYKKKNISDTTLIRKHFGLKTLPTNETNKKFSTLRVHASTSVDKPKTYSYNTISQSHIRQAEARASRPAVTNTSTFLPMAMKSDFKEEDKDESINTVDDNCQGFYWDVTDWTNKDMDTPVHKFLKSPNQIASITNDSINSSNEFINSLFKKESNPAFSPLYSKNYKGIKYSNYSKVENDIDESTHDIHLEVDSTINSFENMNDDLKNKIHFNSASNYMYILNTDECNRTTESQNAE